MILVRHLSRSLLIGGTILAGLALSGTFNPRHAFAAYTVCRTDPIVHLSNGTSVKLATAISDSASDVETVTYTLHVPSGVSLRGTVFTGGRFTEKESLAVYSDNAAGTYTSTTTVETGSTGVAVTATTTLKGSQGGVSTSVSGLSDQALTAQVMAS